MASMGWVLIIEVNVEEEVVGFFIVFGDGRRFLFGLGAGGKGWGVVFFLAYVEELSCGEVDGEKFFWPDVGGEWFGQVGTDCSGMERYDGDATAL